MREILGRSVITTAGIQHPKQEVCVCVRVCVCVQVYKNRSVYNYYYNMLVLSRDLQPISYSESSHLTAVELS